MCTKGKQYNHPTKSLLKESEHTAVYDSLMGNAFTNKNLVVLEDHCIIMRRDHSSMHGKVKILAGGGAGIEPAEAQYVGKGMLTAAVIGKVFNAPSAKEILIAIRELADEHSDGILLLVKNYIGDKLNFGLAMDQALEENILVKMLVIGDDVFVSSNARQGRNGLAGSVLVYKLVGQLAEQGKTIEEIVKECRDQILVDLATVSVTLAPCSRINCNTFGNFLKPEEMMLGVGIYGKGGSKKVEITNLKDTVSLVLDTIMPSIKSLTTPKVTRNEIVVLVNNLGAISKLEEAVISKEVLTQLTELNWKVVQMYTGAFMTTLDTQGFSVSILKVSSLQTISLLNAPTSAPGWPKTDMRDFVELDFYDLPVIVKPVCDHEQTNNLKFRSALFGPALSEKASAAMRQITTFAAEALISCEKQLNVINSEEGDGDTGSVMRRASEALRNAVFQGEMTLYSPSKFLHELSEICCDHMEGVLGALYYVFFKAAAKVFQNATEITSELCSTAFRKAVNAIKHYGKAEVGDRTLLYVLEPAVCAFESAIKNGKNLTEAVHLAAITCEFKAEETKFLSPFTLKNLNFNQSLLYPDAGAHAVTIWLRAVTFEDEKPSEGPGIFLWKFLTEEETNYALGCDLYSPEISSFFEKKLERNQTLLTNLLLDTLKFYRNNYKKNPKVLSALIGTMYYTHRYFLASKWRTPAEVYFYFRESIVRQSLESPPTSMEIFKPEEAKIALVFFFETYMRNLPLIHVLHQVHYRLRLKLNRDNLASEDQDLEKEEEKK